MKFTIDNNKVYGWCVLALVTAGGMQFFDLWKTWGNLFWAVSVFGGIIFIRHTIAKMQNKLDDLKNKEFKAVSEPSILDM